MKSYMKILAAAALCVATGVAQAEHAGADYSHEILVNGSFGSPGQLDINENYTDKQTNFRLAPGYLYTIHPMFQVGLQVDLNYHKNGFANTKDLAYQALALVYFNYPMGAGGLDNSFFFGGGVGVTEVTIAGKDENKLTWRVDAGARWKLFEHITYRPSLGVRKISVTGSKMNMYVDLLGLSVLF